MLIGFLEALQCTCPIGCVVFFFCVCEDWVTVCWLRSGFFFFLSFIHGTFLVLARWVATRIGPMRRSGRLESS